MTLDGAALSGCSALAGSVTCPTAGLSQGGHTINVSVSDSAGNTSSAAGSFFIDTAPPLVSALQPSGRGNSSSPQVSAAFADPSPASGINSATAQVKLDGAVLSGCSSTASGINCPTGTLAPGLHTIAVQVSDFAGNTGAASGSFDVSRNYYWTWYDSASSGYTDWILMANQSLSGTPDLWFNLLIASLSKPMSSLSGYQPGQVPAASVLTNAYPGTVGGPVEAVSTTGSNAVLSQRTLLASGSLEEVAPAEESALSDHYYWAWYDSASAGTTDWVMVANQNPSSVYYEVRIAGQLKTTGTLASGGVATPTYSGLSGGPVEVQAWTSSSKQTAAKVVVTQRVTTNSGGALNDLPGTPADQLSSGYLWTWYDNYSTGAYDWVMLVNQNATPIYYELSVAGQLKANGALNAGAFATPQFVGLIGGPVKVNAWTSPTKQTPAKIVASQRVLFGPSFEEIPGKPETSLKSNYSWPWYDNQTSGAYDWVMVSNTNTTSVYYEIKIAGQLKASGIIQPGAYVTPEFTGLKNGPVEVQAWTDSNKQTTAKVLASQRVLWNGYFNEVWGSN